MSVYTVPRPVEEELQRQKARLLIRNAAHGNLERAECKRMAGCKRRYKVCLLCMLICGGRSEHAIVYIYIYISLQFVGESRIPCIVRTSVEQR